MKIWKPARFTIRVSKSSAVLAKPDALCVMMRSDGHVRVLTGDFRGNRYSLEVLGPEFVSPIKLLFHGYDQRWETDTTQAFASKKKTKPKEKPSK